VKIYGRGIIQHGKKTSGVLSGVAKMTGEWSEVEKKTGRKLSRVAKMNGMGIVWTPFIWTT